VASWDGRVYRLGNNILPGSERSADSLPYVSDVYPLSTPPAAPDGLLRLRIAEFENELSYLDEVRLLYVDLPEGVSVATSGENQLAFVREVSAPVTARDEIGTNLASLLVQADSAAVPFDSGGQVTVTFAVQGAFAKATDGGGGGVTNGSQQKGKEGGGKRSLAGDPGRGKWAASTGMTQAEFYGIAAGIEVAVLDTALSGGRAAIDTLWPREFWSNQYVDIMSHINPAADSVRLQLTWLGDHALDRCFLSLPVAAPPLDTLPLVAATHSVTGSVVGLVADADSSCATLDVGETIDLVFGAPTEPAMGTRQYIFVSKGYYFLYAGKSGGASRDFRNGLPAAMRLSPASPNPGAGWTMIRYELPRPTQVSVRIYDVTGRVVKTVFQGRKEPGYHAVTWNGQTDRGGRASAGIYFVRMEAEGEPQTQKFVLLR